MRLVHRIGQKRVKCETCNKEFSDVSYLTKHKRTHSQLGIFPCDKCDKTFKAKAYRKIHIQTIQNRDANKKFKCVSCNKCFIRKNNLISHMKYVHDDKKEHKCEKCDKAFSAKGDLNKHMEGVHEKKYKCDICSKCLTTNDMLKRHKARFH